ncbi:FtsX-like permease family protein [Mariniphaga sp.]|uniref:FtsX-like permease family protein n=1 Tax=Mariniphaga sp. TaxID=1954475 RepID=UPI00356B2451
MTRLNYILKSFFHYLKANLLVALGVAISTMVLTGSLIIGDSVRHSLEQTTFFRLGETTHLVAVTERYFRQEMATEMEMENPEIQAAPILLLEGVAVADGGQRRVNRVQVVGVDENFEKIAQTEIYSELADNEIVVSRNLAERLEVGDGDNILVRIKKASLIPLNAPFVSDEETSVSLRATIKKVVDKEEMGRFSLKTSQSAPYNLFLSLARLNRLMEFEGKANHILVSSNLSSEEIRKSVENCLTPADAGLKMKHIAATNELEISTERVFMEPKVAQTLEQLPGAKPMITYFINGIGREVGSQKSEVGSQKSEVGSSKSEDNHNQSQSITTNHHQSLSIPYSFVSSLGSGQLADNEIILTQWAADDLNANPGDTIKLKYLEIGPLRQLIDKESEFILKEIVPMSNEWADSTRMPWLPGLSDAGHCREWDAGVPIDLDAIRDKDEDYWTEWGGAPKAYVSLNKALEMWENRFGVYTAVRYPAETFNEENYRQVFAENIRPSDLGMAMEPIREQGLAAAKNGTDFSGLFLGLSFFILAAAIILTALLFRLNLETRSAEIGVLSALGFKEKQVRSFFLLEGFVIALAGGLLGLALSVLYTSAVFRVLNTLWFDIVRTNVLLMKIYPVTLILGLVISLVVSLGAIFISIYRYQNRKTAELQKRTGTEMTQGRRLALDVLMWISILIPVFLLLMQLLRPPALNPMLFFLSGGLLLVGLLLAYRKLLLRMEVQKTGEIRLNRLSQLNLARNRSRSLTVVTLFALGTFLVISTGSYKLDLFANAQDKSSGTGGFLWFAETTMPVLYNLNNPEKRAEEGIYEDFTSVQFRQVEGDDASCLNLNRIAQPAILGVDPMALNGRFSFATRMKGMDAEDPWSALNEPLGDGSIPAIADQTVIQWGLGKKVGDELLYQNEKGDTLRLKLIAGTTPSIFQGYVIISNEHFLKNYPSNSGSYVFLIEGEPEQEEAIGEELRSVYRDYGWEMESTAKRLVEFYSVTNTYLSIFLALGALGMILGTIGLAIILARTILERRREIALMQAIGFGTRQLFRLLVNEYLLLLAAGVLTGFVTAVVATLPSFISSNTDASLGTVALITAIILINGFLWIAGLSWFSLRKKKLVTGLRVE